MQASLSHGVPSNGQLSLQKFPMEPEPLPELSPWSPSSLSVVIPRALSTMST